MKRVVNGGVRLLDNGKFEYDYENDIQSDILDLVPPQLIRSQFQNHVYWFGYTFNPHVESKVRTQFLHHLKGISTVNISKKELVKFISNPLIELSKHLDLHSIDCLVYPRSGRSDLVTEVIKVVNNWSSRHIKRSTFELVKSAPVDIEFDWDRFESEIDPSSLRYRQMYEYIQNTLLPMIHSLDYFSLATNVKPKYRRYIKNFLQFDESQALQFEKLKGKNILIVDDINTSGSTLNEILRILTEINTDCNIYVYTLIGNEGD